MPLLAETGFFVMGPTIQTVTAPVWLGEGPHWDSAEQALYFVSIFDKTVHKYEPDTGIHTRAKLDGMPTFIIPVEGRPHHFVVGLNRKVVEIQWNGHENAARVLRTVAEVDHENPNNRFNDAKADPRGRLFAGTMGHEYEPGKFDLKKGALYRIDPDASVHKLADNIDISNGLCWDVKEKAFYFADSFEYTIRRYDYDIETGNISNPTTVFKYADHGLAGIVDGMTIDTDGNLWVANFDNHQVIKIDPRTSKLLQTVRLPPLQVTSATWGGRELDDLYVTSAAMDRGAPQAPPAGATFRLGGLGARGHPNVSVKLH
ncbi:regucalcin-like isoform X1 [Ostrinia nubilalis]|uniref:regucalcin-like isoform X1 n=2 Tax=Ostrinia nubilalis TaxID=29057 RepID=UPI00308247DB